MKKFLFLVPPFFGHIFPTLAIGQKLVEKGHQVHWIGLMPIKNELLPEGTEFIVPDTIKKNERQLEHIMAMQSEAVRITDEELCEWAFENIWIPFCEMIVTGLTAYIEAYDPDVFVHDECMLAGPIVSKKLNRPYVTSISIGPGLYYPSDEPRADEIWLHKRLFKLQQAYGIYENRLIFDSPELNLVYTARTFALRGDQFPIHYRFLGPIVDRRPQPSDFNWVRAVNDQWPTIYVSLGTVLNEMSQKFLGKVINGLGDQKFNVIVSSDPGLFDDWPDNFYVQKYLPQTDILPKVDLLITTGGYNTVNEALLFGKPMLVIPYGNDQHGNSHMIEGYGCGIRMKHRRVNGERILEKVTELLQNPSYLNSTQMMSEKYEKGGATEAVMRLEEFAKNVSYA